MATVLIVDDLPINRDLMRTLLTHHGHRVLEAGDGVEALDRITDEIPDLVVTDVMMPRMDGYQLVRELRARPETAGVPVIFATSNYLDHEAAPLALGYGVRHVVTKTDEPGKLLEVVDAELGGDRTREPIPIDEGVTREHLRIVNTKLVEKVRETQRSEQQFRLMAESAPVGILLVDAEGKAVNVNTRLTTILGRPADQLTGLAWQNAIGLDGDRELAEVLAGRQDGLTRTKWPIDPPGGGWLDISLRNAYDEQGLMVQCVGVVDDITEKIRAEERQRELDHRLRVAERLESLGQLAAGVAHDFNNVLTSILGHASIAQETTEAAAERGTVDPAVAESLRKSLDGVIRAGTRATRLISQLLAFGRPDIAEPEPVDVNEFLDEIETLLEPLLSSMIKIVKDRDADLWQIFVDGGQLGQIVLNLAVNSRDAMPTGGTIVLRTRNHVVDTDTGPLAPGRYVQLSIADSGHGIPADVLEHALDPFFTTKPVGQGTGLGLATVYNIVRRYGGELVISSIVGEGTTIDVYLPAVAG
ncbi:ATP-binding response regulator [Lentzea nigeriaca]|uniref:ATP-binding response regulator n=1 Tax=Lentzea nigeriaca TaxID=1128665 RepID=UPI001956629E|nr:response regulator [Lentzea nigeriaca]MBM7865109.1 PAS domain S-box-containing protein [Lentzea nigeriaca]